MPRNSFSAVRLHAHANFRRFAIDNLTTTIVLVSLLRKLIHDHVDRLRIVRLVVIAGGTWTVIGDVTTTMLWVQHKLDTAVVMQELFLGSLVCVIIPLIGFSYFNAGKTIAGGPPSSSPYRHPTLASMIVPGSRSDVIDNVPLVAAG
tara:strand:+ start:84 stop:524 length:441 start_codon:yes stop_codon:yes gene_type:complete